MRKNIKVLFLISTLVILLVGLGTISAQSLDDSQDVFDDSLIDVDSNVPEQSDLKSIEKQTFENNVKGASEASDYAELKSYVNGATDAETEINLEEKTYAIDESIVWGTSETAKTLTINGNGATIDGSNNYQFMTVNEGYTLNLNNLIIQNTLAENGSAIRNYGTLNVNNVTFKDNVAQKTTGKLAGGAAIYSEGTLNIEGNSHFIGNRIVGGVNGDGAAIYTNSAIYVKDTQFDSNIAEYTDADSNSNGANGGAICVENSTSDMIIINSTFTNNKGRHGGAINIFDKQGRNQGTKKITGSTFKGNQAIYGGAIEVYNDLIIEDSTFEENSVKGVGSSNYKPLGGAICSNNLTDTGLLTLSIKNTTFERNTAPQTEVSGSTLVGYGGAIYSSAIDTIIDNCTFVENSAYNGGAYYCSEGDRNKASHATITGSKFKSNVARDGAAIYDSHAGTLVPAYQDTLTIDKSLFEDNNPTSNSYYGIYARYDNLTITNSEIKGNHPISVGTGGTSNTFSNVTVNELHNISRIYISSPVVSPTNYPELVIVSKEINNEYTGTDTVYISLEGTEYIETEPILFENNTCAVIFYGNYKTIDANGQQFLTVGEGKKVTINNMTIANAKADRGAAIINYGTLNTQNKVIFDNNEALYYGGAIYSTGNLSVTTTNFTNNKVSTIKYATRNDYGGAAICSLGKLTVSKSNFIENVAEHNDVEPRGDGGCGGAINVLNTTQAVSITTSNFTRNSARHGGAILINNNDKVNTQKVTIDKNNFDENTALYGGAIDTYQQVNITNNNFTKNTVKGQGSGNRLSMGAAIVLNTGNSPYTAIVTNNTFKENEAQEGGTSGVIHTQQDTTLTSSYNKYLDNKAFDTGVVTNLDKATFTNDVFTGNSADYTGVFTNYNELTITDCTFEDNEGNGYGDLVYAFNDVTITGSKINSDNLEALIAGDHNVVATDNIVNGETLSERLIKTTLTITPETTLLIDEDNIITATLIDATDVPVVGKEVNVVINGETVGTNKTDENGIVSYIYKPAEGTSATIKFTFTPDDYYIESESEEITVDLIGRQATVIEYEVLNDIEGKVVLDIRVYEEETEDLIINAKIDLSGDVTTTNVRTNKVYKNTELEAGEHTITATYNGLENVYKPSTLDITFTVIEDPSKLIEELEETIDTMNDTINDQATQISDLNDTINDLNDALDEANDKIDDLNDALNEAKDKIDELSDELDVANDKIDELSDELDVANDKIDELSDKIDEILEMIKKDTVIVLDEIPETVYGNYVTISGKLTDSNGLELSEQNLSITINNQNYDITTDENGIFTYDYRAKTIGINNVTVSYDGNEKYNPHNTKSEFETIKCDVIVTFDEIAEVVRGENVTITGKFTTVEGKPISNSNVRVFINGVKYLARTDKTGTYTLSTKTTVVGLNNVTVAYAGNDNYNAYETNGTFNVVKQDVIVTFNPIEDVAYGSNVTITGTFTDVNGKSIGNSNVKIIINGKKYYARTDSSGAFTFTAKTIDMGINEVSIGYSGNENYNSYETTTTFNVGKQDVIVTYNPIDPVASGENVTITGKFTNAEGKAIISSNVKIVINGKKYYARTDNNGVYVFTMPITTTGINNVTVGYSGNDKYNSYEINTTFVCL